MWQERSKRILIILAAFSLSLFAGKAFADWRVKREIAGEKIKLPTEALGNKIEEMGSNVLGKAVSLLPGSDQLKEKIIEGQKVVEEETEKSQIENTTQTQATQIIENQTNQIIETIKKMPQEQLKQIQKQIFKDFCEDILKE